jgi:hypothetical protein
MMTVTSTCTFILLLIVWLCHVTTTLNASAGYYMNPFLQHTQYIRLSLDPQRTSSAFVLSGHNTVVVQERPIVDNQKHLMTRDSHILDNQGDITTRDEPVVGRQPDAMYQGEPLVLNQSQDIEDPCAQMQVKYALNPCRRRKEVSVRGGDSVTFVEDTYVQKSDPYIKLVAGGSSFPARKTANDVPDCTTSKPHPTVQDPSHCVWAIISCCSPGSNEVRNPCFELLGCPGPFWDTNPCNKGMTASAVKVVHQFYSSGKQE